MSHWAPCPIIEHITQSDHCTFTCMYQVHVNMQWSEYLTCASKCAVNQTLGSLHISMHISVIRLTPNLHEHIEQSDQCTFTCTHQVHVNVQWHKCLTCASKARQLTNCTFSCTHRSLGSLPNYLRTSGACKRAVTRESDVCVYMCIESYAWLTMKFNIVKRS